MKTNSFFSISFFHFSFLLLSMLVFEADVMGQVDSVARRIAIAPEFDYVMDRFGNRVPLSDLIYDPDAMEGNQHLWRQNTSCPNSYFELYFRLGSGFENFATDPTHAARADILCKVMQDLSAFIIPVNPQNKVRISIGGYTDYTTGRAIALANPYLPFLHGKSSISDTYVWQTINSGVDGFTNIIPPIGLGTSSGATFFHGNLEFNSLYLSQFITPQNPSGTLDLYSVALHEMTHLLGFGSGLAPVYFSGVQSALVLSRYDLALRSKMGLPLLTNGSMTGSCQFYNFIPNPAVSPTDLIYSPQSPNSVYCEEIPWFDILAYPHPRNRQPVYSPSVYAPGSSFGHFDDRCEINPSGGYQQSPGRFIMNPTSNLARAFSQEERDVLCQLGYKVNTTFGSVANNNLTAYTGGVCGNHVAGVHDGITNNAYTYSGTINTPIPIPGLLSNDYPVSGLTFECLEVGVGAGAISISNGNYSTIPTFTPTSYGIHILRYIPVDAQGKKGNITYVVVFVYDNINCAYQPCSLLPNPDFEGFVGSGGIGNPNNINGTITNTLQCWSVLSWGPALYNTTSQDPDFTLPPPIAVSRDRNEWIINGNTNSVQMGSGGIAEPNIDAMQVQIPGGIAPGVYTLSLRARCVSGSSTIFPSTIAVISHPSTVPLINQLWYRPIDITNSGFTILSQVVVPTTGQWEIIQVPLIIPPSPANNTIGLANITFPNTSNVFIDDVRIIPNAAVSFDLPPCVGNASINLLDYTNQPGGIFSGAGVSGNTFGPQTAGAGTHVITYTYTNNIGCVVVATDRIQVSNFTPTITQLNICEGHAAELSTTGGGTYLWSTGETSPTIYVPIPTQNPATYRVTVTDANGCIGIATRTVTPGTPTVQRLRIGSLFNIPNVAVARATYGSTFNTTGNANIVLGGIFTVEQNISFSGRNFLCLPGSGVDVNASRTLTTNSCTYNACHRLWRGIYLLRNSGLDANSSTFRNAENAIRLDEFTSSRIRSCSFESNYIGIHINLPNSTKNISLTQFLCERNTFRSNGWLMAPRLGESGLAGIVAWRVNAATIGSNNQFLGLIPPSNQIYQALQNGIMAHHCGLITVMPCTFRDIKDEGYGIFFDGGNAIVGSSTLKQWGYGKTSTTATFDNCSNGIFASRCHVNVINNRMSRVAEGINVSLARNADVSIANNQINCLGKGIGMYQCQPVRHVSINDNLINVSTANSPNGFGISLDENNVLPSQQYLVGSNTINVTDAGMTRSIGIKATNTQGIQLYGNTINLLTPVLSHSGIHLANVSNSTISCNAVNSTSATAGNSSLEMPAGIWMADSKGNELTCNNLSNIRNGIKIDNDCAQSATRATSLKGNTYNNNRTGLRYSRYANSGVQRDMGNQWLNMAWTTYDAVHEGFTTQQVQLSRYDVENLQAINYPSISFPNAPASTQWFFQSLTGINTFRCSTSSSNICGYALFDPNGPALTQNQNDILDQQDEYTAEGTPTNPDYEETQLWKEQQELYEKLEENPILLTPNSVFEEFKEDADGTLIEDFYELREEKDAVVYLSPADETQLDLIYNQVKLLGDEILQLEEVLYDSIPDPDSTDLVLELVSNNSSLEALLLQEKLILEGIENLKLGNTNLLITENGLLPNSEVFYTNEKMVNEIYLNTIAKGNTDFTQQQKDDLFYIANQCPLAGGDAVYNARSLYSLVSNPVYLDKNICAQSGVLMREIRTSDLEGEVFPNPSSGLFTLSLSKELEKECTLIVTNALGQQVESIYTPSGMRQFEFYLDLSNGVYTCQLVNDLDILLTAKITIIK